MMAGTETVEPFASNWAYLKVELNWLERLLMVSAARQRKETREVNRVARSAVDRATSHWWQGLIALEGTIASDSPATDGQGRAAERKDSYGERLEARIQATARCGGVLALPLLRDRLKLSAFEKSVVLMALAIEVNQRYGRLFGVLQGDERAGLPTVGLLLRLLCRNDREWQMARASLQRDGTLRRYGVIQLVRRPEQSLLADGVMLAEPWTDFLLAIAPQPSHLESLVVAGGGWADLELWSSAARAQTWDDLLLPPTLKEQLRHLRDRQQWIPAIAAAPAVQLRPDLGTRALFVGPSGTGKTAAASAIATDLAAPLWGADLALLDSAAIAHLLTKIIADGPPVVMLKAAHRLVGRQAQILPEMFWQFWQARSRFHGITLLCAPSLQGVPLQVRRALDQVLVFPLPTAGDRRQLWQRFLAGLPLEEPFDWERLVRHKKWSGGDIEAIARATKVWSKAHPNQAITVKQILMLSRR